MTIFSSVWYVKHIVKNDIYNMEIEKSDPTLKHKLCTGRKCKRCAIKVYFLFKYIDCLNPTGICNKIEKIYLRYN